MIISVSIHVAAVDISFILWLINILLCLCVCITSSLSVDGHLHCFPVLAIVNSAAMNTGVHVPFRIRVFSGYTPRSGIAGSHGNPVFSFFKDPPYCSPQWLHQLTFPPRVWEGSFSFTPAPAFVICRLCMMALLTGVSCSFDFQVAQRFEFISEQLSYAPISCPLNVSRLTNCSPISCPPSPFHLSKRCTL